LIARKKSGGSGVHSGASLAKAGAPISVDITIPAMVKTNIFFIIAIVKMAPKILKHKH